MLPASKRMEVTRFSTPGQPALDMLLTGAMLRDVAERHRPATVRVFRPGPTVAFGRRDGFAPGYEQAVEAARLSGFAAAVRHAGGHAVAYDEGSIIVELIRPESHPVGGIEDRFVELTMLIQRSLGIAGVPVDVGELPGEYCAGRFSLHLRDGAKVVGVAQRVIKGASLTTAAVTVGSGDRLRAVTARVYRELGLALDVSTVGAIADRFDIDPDPVANIIAENVGAHFGATLEHCDPLS